MIASFDDGSPEIPGGIVGRVERVLVIGAGIAGLTVAPPMRTLTCSAHRWPAACSSRASVRRARDSATPTAP
jgi:hypothetical protein